MARQRLGPKKLRQLAQQTGLDIVKVQVRGNTNHRRDLFLKDGRIVYLYSDGTTEESDRRWSQEYL